MEKIKLWENGTPGFNPEFEQEETTSAVSKKEFDKLSTDVNELKAMVKEIADGKHSA